MTPVARKPVAIVLAPSREAISGVTTHLNLLLGSALADDFALIHFQVGSEGRDEGAAGRIWRLLWSPLALLIRIRLAGAALVHINTSLNRRAWWRDLAYLFVAKLCGTRVVYQVHGGHLPQRFGAVAGVPTPLLRWLLMLPDAVVVLARCELSAYRQFLPRQTIAALPNGIDIAPFEDRSHGARTAQGTLRLAYVGRLSAEKGLAETLDGLALARGLGAAATLTIAGDGPEEGALKTLAARLGLAGAVQFAGPLFGEEKRRLLAEADVLILPSHFEGLPYALLEGMAAGLPAITTRVGGIPDVVGDGVHGLFVPVENARAISRAILRLWRNPSMRAAMSIAAQRRIRRSYSIGRLAGEFRALYGALCCPADERRTKEA